MRPTPREVDAAQNLANAFLAFLVAFDEAHINSIRQSVAPLLESLTRPRVAEPSPPVAPTPVRATEPSPERLLNTRQAAQFLGIHVRTLWRLVVPNGPIPVVHIGRSVRIALADLEAFVEGMTTRPRKGQA